MLHFHHYPLRGGFSQIVQIDSVHQMQRLLREDIIDTVLKRDLEHTLLNCVKIFPLNDLRHKILLSY